MKRPSWRAVRRCERGAVAVEAALIMAFILAPLLGFMFFFGNFFWHYTVVQKSLHDATLYMASAPLSEIRSNAAENVASYIITREMSDTGSSTTLEPEYYCGVKVSANSDYLIFRTCDDPDLIPGAVQISAKMTAPDPFFFGQGRIQLYIPVTLRYVGR